LADRVSRIRAHASATPESLKADRDAFDVVAFNLMLAVQICADIASHIIADEGWSSAKNLGEAFTRLEEHGLLTRQLADAMRRAVGLRNVVAHGYAGVDTAAVHAAATSGVSDLKAFAQAIGAWASARSGQSEV
ncbi:MAG TPA: DUF86 domain-containing protein, partial [Polyangiaceae bacterium]|nr:DUF86 domain-containing protein [Polyangiaceae bacterium]